MRRAALVVLVLLVASGLPAQVAAPTAERTYDAAIERVKQALKADIAAGGKLPALDGFVPTDLETDRYQRPHYEFRVETVAEDAAHTKVRVQARISAWYADAAPGRSEYRSLISNGRLESDLLDRLQDWLGESAGTSSPGDSNGTAGVALAGSGNSSVRESNAVALLERQIDNLRQQRQALEAKSKVLTAEVAEWDERIHRQKTEVGFATVKRSGAAVMARMSYSGPVLFRTRAEDEFEPLAQDREWVQVRTGPDSTGWMLADELALPEGVVLAKPSGTATEAVNSSTFRVFAQSGTLSTNALPAQNAVASGLGQEEPSSLGFWISHEEVNAFAGDWAKLKGKKALFVFVQPRGLLSGMASDDRKLAFAKGLFTARFLGATDGKSGYEGIVVIFSGGKNAVAAALVSDIRDWTAGKISDAGFIQRCSLDPADEFRASEAIASSTK